MTISFDSVMIGSVVECANGRRLIKLSNKRRQSNAQDADENPFHVPGPAMVTVLTSPVKMGKSYIKAYNAREAEAGKKAKGE